MTIHEGTPLATFVDSALRMVGLHNDPYLTVGTFPPNVRGVGNPLPLRQTGLNVHSWIIGQTGMGKSYHLISQMRQLLAQGVGFSFIDPHDTCELLLSQLVAEGFFNDENNRSRVIFVEFLEDGSWCLPLNFLNRPHVEPATIAQQMLDVFHRLWPNLGHGAAPRFDDIMLNGMIVLVVNHLPLTCMEQLLSNKRFRERLLDTMTDESYTDVVRFFRGRFLSWGRNTPEYIDSTLTRISTLLTAKLLKYSIGQQAMALDFRAIMDSGTVMIYNLGRVQNEDVRRFLGCLITKGYENAALSRQDVPNWQRVPHHMIIDEFHDFSENSSDALSKTLTAGRKYGLFATMCHQNFDQTNIELQHAIETNATVKKAFRVGRSDAEILAHMFGEISDEVKHLVDDESARGRTQPVFYNTGEQWEHYIHSLMHLRKQRLLVKIGVSPTQQVVSVPVPKLVAEPKKLAEVRADFLRDLQKPIRDVRLVHYAVQPDGSLGRPKRGDQLDSTETPAFSPRRKRAVKLPWSVDEETN